MTSLPAARAAAREFLKASVCDARPEWRTAFTTDGTDGPTGVAPVCTDTDNHEPDGDGDLWSCCPDLAFETGSPALAEYLVALLNEERGR